MKLTKSTDYALRLIIHLAKTEQPETMPTLSKKLCISYNHLSKLVQKLTKAGYLKTYQGKFGGVGIVPEKDISLKNIIDIIDGPTILTECHSPTSSCGLLGDCHLKDVMGQIQAKIDALFEDVKIRDLIATKELAA